MLPVLRAAARRGSRLQLRRCFASGPSARAPSLVALRSLQLFRRPLSPVSQFYPFRSLLHSSSTTYSSSKEKFERLPLVAKPVHYNLTLTPALQEFTFEGAVSIDLLVSGTTSTLVLNAADLEIQNASYSSDEGTITPAISINKGSETVTFTFDKPLKIGSGSLAIHYTGQLNEQMKGFYRSKYTAPDGQVKYAATTQLEPTDARRALPCWDEPSIKSTFDVTLVVPQDRVALSNMPVKTEEPLPTDAACKVVTFERTPIMSTYLLAFIVGEYDYIEARDEDGVLSRVYTPVGKSEQGRFALDVAVKTLPFYKNYIGVPYPLPKLDQIAIADFAAGAMENWGLVTYRESALLIDPERSSVSTKMRVSLIVCHELAHMWFGNLVTMDWWTHLWLNEGFASFLEYEALDHCFPEYDIWTQFVSQDLGRALKLDALASSHPIEVEVGHPKEIDEIFDAISYSKGCCMVRMLNDWLGNETLRHGLAMYLKKHQYSSTVTEDLWESLGEASGLPVRQVMSTWTSQMGYPVISVSERQEGDNRVLTLTQEKFCADGKKPERKYQWMVPMKFMVCGKDRIVTYLLEGETGEVTIPNVQPGDVIKVNPSTVGFYRVRYDSSMLDGLTQKMASLNVLDRLSLVNDVFALASAGLAPVGEALQLTQSFRGEDNYTVWYELLTNLSGVAAWVRDTDFDDLMDRFHISLLQQVTDDVGWEASANEGPMRSMLRTLVLGKMGRSGHKPTVTEARRRLDLHLSGEQTLPADLRTPVYSTVLKHGPPEYFNKMLEEHEKADSQEERDRIGQSLGSVQDGGQIDHILKMVLTDKVRNQDLPAVVAGCIGTNTGRQKAWEFYKNNNKAIIDMYQGGFLLGRTVGVCSSSFSSEEAAQELEEFMRSNPAPGTARAVDQTVEGIRLKAAMKERDAASVKAFLSSQ